MRSKLAWMLGIFGIAVSALLVTKEHLDLAHGSVVEWLMPAFRYFDYPGFLAAPLIVRHLPFIFHGDISTKMTEVYLTDGIYIVVSGLEWFVVGAVLSMLARKLHKQ